MDHPRRWADLTSRDFVNLDPETVIAILPLGAIEQHGPHLPLGTDTCIAHALKEAVLAAAQDQPLVILPVQTIGVSTEHRDFPGTLTLSPETALRCWLEIGDSIARAGLRKLIVLNAHGGNSPVIDLMGRELRARHRMLVVNAHWTRFGHPDSLHDAREARIGIHAGRDETALMQHIRPESVRRDEARDFFSLQETLDHEMTWLSAGRPAPFSWMVQDLNIDGATGDACKATPEMGAELLRHAVEGICALIDDVRRFPLSRLRDHPS